MKGIALSHPTGKQARAGVDTFKKPRPDASRVLAFQVFSEVNQGQAYANLILPRALSESNLELRDRAFVTELVYG
ncbi:MAG: hypothetical protein F2870_03365, partial [Actinobacteria bacterium]|nr:hypothetical protein [Actinomycetota bacterium]